MQVAGEELTHVTEAELSELGLSSVADKRPDAIARRVRFLRDAIGREVTPPGFEDVVLQLKEQPGVENPWAVAWAMHNRGVQPKSEAGAPYQPAALLKRLRFAEAKISHAN